MAALEVAGFLEEELADIATLRSKLSDMNHEGTLAHTLLSEDSTMWRYITSQSQENNPMEKAEEMFRSSCQWRDDIQLVDTLYPEWRGCNNATVSDEGVDGSRSASNTPRALSARARFGDLIYHGGILDATCRIGGAAPGGPVLLERLGMIDLPGIYADEYAFACAQNSYIINLEEAWNRVRAASKDVPKVRGMFIMDMTGTGLSMLGYISTIRALTKQGILRYPEISQRVYLANAGWVLSTLWEAAKPFIPARTLFKVKISGGSSAEQAAIFDDVEGGAASLPVYLGGDLSPEECPQLCPAMSVDEAYGVVLKELLDSHKKKSTYLLGLSSDTETFLNAALRHARTFPGSSIIHSHRIDDICALKQALGFNDA